MSIGKIKVSNGLQKKASKMNLGGTHITTMDFGRLQVLHCSLLQPKDKVNLDIRHHIRLSPLVAPTIGNCKLKTKAFFVPSRVAWNGWDSFIAETPWSTTGATITPNLPKVGNGTLAGVFNQAVSYPNDNKVVGFSGIYGVNADINRTYTTNVPWLEEAKNGTIRAPYFDVHRPLGEILGITDGYNPDGTTLKHFVPFSHLESVGIGYDIPVYDWDNVVISQSTDGFDYITLPCWGNGSTDARLHYGVFNSNYPTQKFSGQDAWKNQCHYFVCRFTRYGKALYNLLLGLGYKINFQSLLVKENQSFVSNYNSIWDSSAKPSSTSFTPSGSSSSAYDKNGLYGFHSIHNNATYWDSTVFNAMPLYAFMRMYLDYFAPTQFYQEFERVIDWYQTSNNYQCHWSDIWSMADLLFTSYEKDIFTSCWQQPNSPVTSSSLYNFSSRNYSTIDAYSGESSDLIDVDHTGAHGQFISNTEKASGVLSNPSAGSSISDLAIRLVRAMTKYSRINNVFGYRPVDRFLGKYGIRPSDERVNRAEMIGGSKSEFDIDLVMSQADTSTANLGDFVGHGQSTDVSNLGHYTATEWGYLFIVAWITPKTMYYQGRNRMTLYTEAKDFHDPLIDDLDAMQSIRYDELVADSKSALELQAAPSYKPSNVFGFTRMWHECKHGYDYITGDFYIDSCGKYSNQSFHLGRTLPSVGNQSMWNNNQLRNDAFFNLCLDGYQYDRIFQTSDVTLDHFYCYFKIDVICYRYTKALSDFTLDDENDDTRVSSIEMFGTQVS